MWAGSGGVYGRSVGDGSELLTRSCSRQVCDGPPLMLLETNQQLQAEAGVQISNSLVRLSNDGVLLANRHSLTHKIEEVGCATPVVVVELDKPVAAAAEANVRVVNIDGTEDQP